MSNKNFKKTFGYNKYSTAKEKEFNEFITTLVSTINSQTKTSVSIVGSASKVPTRIYESNKALAAKRVEEAVRILTQSLSKRNIDISKIKITKSSIVSGPDYNFDRSDKAKYFEHQYFSITID
jgi:hypothetical protein